MDKIKELPDDYFLISPCGQLHFETEEERKAYYEKYNADIDQEMI